MTLRVAELCAGYGGIGAALTVAGIDHQVAWYSEIDPAASTVMARHHPTAPNIGDLTKADPNDLEPVDLITAGFPCQNISPAGRGEGIHGPKSRLWWTIRDTISVLRPRYVLLENSAAILTRGGTEVVGSLTELGYDSRWTTVRASGIGAPHGRPRWFCLATDTEGFGLERPRGSRAGGGRPEDANRHALLPTPTASQQGGTAEHHLNRKRGGRMNRANPTVTDLGLLVHAAHNPHHLLPTCVASDAKASGSAGYQTETRNSGLTLTDAVIRQTVDWERFRPAIQHWEQIHGPHPNPVTDTGKLNPQFSEWMMGLPRGHVTDTPVSGTAMLRCIGNGVVPAQCAAAIRELGFAPALVAS